MAALGIVALGVAGLDLWEREFVVNRVGSDVERIESSMERLAWIGRDAPPLRTRVAKLLGQQGELDRAIDEFQASLDLYPTAAAWVGLGRVYALRSQLEEASQPSVRPWPWIPTILPPS